MSDDLLSNTSEILIIHHLQEDCIEIIGYDNVKKIEAPRIYISGGLLFCKMSKQSFDRNLFRCREEGAPFDFFNGGIDEFLCDVLYGYAITFILSRLVIHENDHITSNKVGFTLGLEAKTGDKSVPYGSACRHGSASEKNAQQLGSLSQLDVIIPKPSQLKPFDRIQYRKEQQALLGRSGSMHGRLLQAVLTAFQPPPATTDLLSASLEPTRRWQKSAHEVIQKKHIVRFHARTRTFCDEEESFSSRSMSGPSSPSVKRTSLTTTTTSAALISSTPFAMSSTDSVFSRSNLLSKKKSVDLADNSTASSAQRRQKPQPSVGSRRLWRLWW